MSATPRFSIQADPAEVGSWQDFALGCERDGFDALLVADHPGTGSAPFVALGAAASITERIRLGSYVVNAGVWEPLNLAVELATLDRISEGRALLGIGAGHTPAEWTMRGREYPSGQNRVARMMELVDVTRRLLDGEMVSFRGEQIVAAGAVIQAPEPVQKPVPLLVGGNGRTVLRFAAREADIVGFSGLGRTLEDGHRHEVRWQAAEVDQRVEMVRAAADKADRAPALEALVQYVEITDDAENAAERLAGRVRGLEPSDVLAAPYALVGTIEELVAELRSHRDRWGFERFVVRAPFRQEAARIIFALP